MSNLLEYKAIYKTTLYITFMTIAIKAIIHIKTPSMNNPKKHDPEKKRTYSRPSFPFPFFHNLAYHCQMPHGVMIAPAAKTVPVQSITSNVLETIRCSFPFVYMCSYCIYNNIYQFYCQPLA